MTIIMSLNILLYKEHKTLLDPPPLTYPEVPSTRSDNTLSNQNNNLRGSDISGDIYCIYEVKTVYREIDKEEKNKLLTEKPAVQNIYFIRKIKHTCDYLFRIKIHFLVKN